MDGFTIVDGVVAGAHRRLGDPGLRARLRARVAVHRRLDRRGDRWPSSSPPAVEPLMREIPMLGDFIGIVLRAVDHRRLRGRLRGGAGHRLDLHAALLGRGAALGARPARPGPRASCSAWRAACCWSRSPSSSTTGSSAAPAASPMVDDSRTRARLRRRRGAARARRCRRTRRGWIARQYEQLVGVLRGSRRGRLTARAPPSRPGRLTPAVTHLRNAACRALTIPSRAAI